jgi:plastocyanin
MAKKGLDDRGHGLGRRAAARLPLSRAVIIAMLLGSSVGGLLAYGAVAAQEEPNVVSIDNYTFGPKELTVPLGTTVKWVNHDDVPHTVAQKDKAFRSMALDTDDSYFYTFASAGTFDYFCGLHPYMVGKIIVK